jgi:hypothetical protein
LLPPADATDVLLTKICDIDRPYVQVIIDVQSKNNKVVARATADRNTLGQLPQRVATYEGDQKPVWRLMF